MRVRKKQPSYESRCADQLYDWLVAHTGDLPGLSEIALKQRRIVVTRAILSEDLWRAFNRLAREGLIVDRHGTSSVDRGHRAVRIVATGRVLKTQGCPFDAPLVAEPRVPAVTTGASV